MKHPLKMECKGDYVAFHCVQASLPAYLEYAVVNIRYKIDYASSRFFWQCSNDSQKGYYNS